jgi:predicted NBD/HSP70 family sugar kinase
MSQPTAGRIVDQLLELGVLEELSEQQATETVRTGKENGAVRLGRPGRLLRLDSTKPRFLTIQLGISKTNFAVVPVGFKSEDVWALQIPTPSSEKKFVQELREVAANLSQEDFWGVMVSAPGIVDEQSGRIVFSPNLHWTERVEMSKLMQQVWNAPVVLVQEERALALGHQFVEPLGEDFMLVDFGEGVGGAVFLEGKLYANPLPISGELGHTPVLGNRRACGCGGVGCVETLISTRGLLQSFAENPGGENGSTWQALVEYTDREGLAPWLALALDAAAVAIAGALNVLGLRRVVITGSVAEMPPVVVKRLSSSIIRGAVWARFGKVECQSAPRRRIAGLVASGIDRLIISMAEQNSGPEPLVSMSLPQF